VDASHVWYVYNSLTYLLERDLLRQVGLISAAFCGLVHFNHNSALLWSDTDTRLSSLFYHFNCFLFTNMQLKYFDIPLINWIAGLNSPRSLYLPYLISLLLDLGDYSTDEYREEDIHLHIRLSSTFNLYPFSLEITTLFVFGSSYVTSLAVLNALLWGAN